MGWDQTFEVKPLIDVIKAQLDSTPPAAGRYTLGMTEFDVPPVDTTEGRCRCALSYRHIAQ